LHVLIQPTVSAFRLTQYPDNILKKKKNCVRKGMAARVS